MLHSFRVDGNSRATFCRPRSFRQIFQTLRDQLAQVLFGQTGKRAWRRVGRVESPVEGSCFLLETGEKLLDGFVLSALVVQFRVVAIEAHLCISAIRPDDRPAVLSLGVFHSVEKFPFGP